VTKKIDYYKVAYGCQYDGETIFRAATHLMLMKTLRSGAEQTAYALGITKEMGREEICKRMAVLLGTADSEGLRAALEIEIRNMREDAARIFSSDPETTRSQLEGGGQQAREGHYRQNHLHVIARRRVDEVMRQIINFCEEEMME